VNENLSESPSTAKLLAAEPQLFVRDIQASCAFYTTKLGFKIGFTYGEPTLNLRHLDRPKMESPLSKKENEDNLLAASITVDDVDSLYLEFHSAGAELAQPLKSESWGARTFIVKDPDGNLILFAGDAK
jgi:catechol 2,3-dioxygenase-like lactoylglutathione lyase family enzyme